VWQPDKHDFFRHEAKDAHGVARMHIEVTAEKWEQLHAAAAAAIAKATGLI